MYRLNLAFNGQFAPAGGMPLKLSGSRDAYASGVCPSYVTSVSATVYADLQADVHLALYSAPLVANASDSALLAQTDALAVTSTPQTLTVDVPVDDLTPDAITPSGSITISNGSRTVAGSGTAFPIDGQWTGYELSVKGYGWYQVYSVESTTSLTLANQTAAITAAAGPFFVRRPRPKAYVVMIWCDNILGGTVETVTRDSSVLTVSAQPQVPNGITISSMVIA